MRFKKEWYELIFRIQWSIYDGAFMRKQLRLQASSQIFGQGLNTPLMNKILFSFQKKTTLKATYLGIRMYCTKLLLWQNQKASTSYTMILHKRYSTADILFGIFNFFWTSYFTEQLKTTDCNGFLFAQNVIMSRIIIVFVGMRKGNFLNVIGEIMFRGQW